jgi:general nucleoside transport system ATP-binding protein
LKKQKRNFWTAASSPQKTNSKPLNASQTTLRVQNISKKFGSLVALEPTSVNFLSGEIHAVVGENGAGKSTLMNIIGGFLAPDTGSCELLSESLSLGNPAKIRRAGIEMVHQHFMLVPAFTVAENIELSLLAAASNATIADVKAQAAKFGWEIPWLAKVQDLSVGIQQRIEILKTLTGTPKVLILDEPTAVLGREEVRDLFQLLRQLAAIGTAVILIAHKVEEILASSDRITILRRGVHIGTYPREELDADIIVEKMVGAKVSVGQSHIKPNGEIGIIVSDLLVKGDRGETAINGVAFEIFQGEILGIGGVDGNGQMELSEAMAGIRPFGGNIEWSGKRLDFGTTPVGFVPQDRRVDGLVLPMSIAENMLISELKNQPKFISQEAVKSRSRLLIQEFSVKASGPEATADSLSGGNQQKVILARTLAQNPKILVVVNPTRGLDVKAAEFVHQRLRDSAQGGTSVLLVSTDRDELAQVANRCLYLGSGQLFETEAEALKS